ncbi:hypothetical protein BX661DRAFT_38059 [Kickxella alabastrina]|uniref:uncharacterized protein n=1 Tax=Kickxella alabastrina TaxID=61397 RepID=UPI0022212557|nr:uncharacterized protein BX661DRAFT_38059 [Kickxella alabastrina]KAI7825412.1 hypothetical protein BX661DRAFT_38059 [Kickxella alabastrina]
MNPTLCHLFYLVALSLPLFWYSFLFFHYIIQLLYCSIFCFYTYFYQHVRSLREIHTLANTTTTSTKNRAWIPDNYPQVILSVHNKTSEIRVVYVSSNIRNILQYKPEDIVGHPAFSYIADGNSQKPRSIIGLNTRYDITIANVNVFRAPKNQCIYVSFASTAII